MRYNIILILCFSLLLNCKEKKIATSYNSLSEASKYPEYVYELDLSNQKISKLPKDFGKFTNLIELNLAYNDLEQLPASFGNLKSLKKLSFYENNFSKMPNSIFKLTNLEILSFAENKIKSIPKEIGKLIKLEVLHLQFNELTEIDEAIGNLVNLTDLRLYVNKLKKLPNSFGNLKKIEDLWLQSNQLESLPDSFGNLTEIGTIDLDDNRLITLPESFGNLINLRGLDLEKNRLKYLPESFGNLKKLYALNLKYNEIELLPNSFKNLANLETLDLSNNKFLKYPYVINNLEDLREINLYNNEIIDIEKEVIKQLEIDTTKIARELMVYKELPNSVDEILFVIPEIENEVLDYYEELYYELTSHIIIANSITGKIKYQFSESSKTNGWISDAIMLTEINIDTTSYKLTKTNEAFGIIVNFRGSSQPNPYYSNYLSLYIKENNSLKKIIHNLEIYESIAEINMSECGGEFENKEKKITITNSTTNSYYDILVEEKTINSIYEINKDGDCENVEKSRIKRAQILKYDNTNYQ